jgi:hypothetical protein
MTIEDTTIESFGFTEVVDEELPYHAAGYARAVCTDPNRVDSYAYTPPSGWKAMSCILMPPGTHGVPDGQPTVLVWCEPESDLVAITESPTLSPQNPDGLPGAVAAGAVIAATLLGYSAISRKK